MKKLKKIDLEKRLEMLDKLSAEDANRLLGGYLESFSVNTGGGTSVGGWANVGSGGISSAGMSVSYSF